MSRVEQLRAVVDALHAEIAALKRFDVAALAVATGAKEAGIGALAGTWRQDEVDDEVRALAEEAQRLNETSRIYVNLMAANVRARLDALTGLGAQVYTRSSAAA
ncbi:flagellar protein FlgN [Sphingomonas flavalba]|uniref:flagellar protein FlgN n=1 Tax=Sphingomonas flavalba TaxID=2559804 RepID=UPI0039E086C8